MKALLVILSLFALSACDTGIRQMGPTEYGVIFRRLPPQLGGGVSDKVVLPGQMVIVWPWDVIYGFDTSVQEITWGAPSQAGEEAHRRAQKISEAMVLQQSNAIFPAEQFQAFTAQQSRMDAQPDLGASISAGYVNSRALDGNEVALAVTVRYKVTNDPRRLSEMVRKAATSNDDVRALVVAVARSDIRTFMNKLKTSEFLDDQARYAAVDKARASMASRLEPYGIEINGVILNEYRFERVLADQSIDSSYGDRLKQIQRLGEDTSREKSRIETVRAKKQQEFNEAQGRVNRVIAEVQGYRDQAKSRGDSYLTAKQNEARGIRARGEAEVKGMIEQINALSGPGGQELLKLEIARQLTENQSRFVLVDQGAQGIDVKRIDTNELISQIGLMEGLKDQAPAATRQAADTQPPSSRQLHSTTEESR